MEFPEFGGLRRVGAFGANGPINWKAPGKGRVNHLKLGASSG